jgi:hypothetical protein
LFCWDYYFLFIPAYSIQALHGYKSVVKRLLPLLLLLPAPALSIPVVPNFQQGVLQQHVETSSVVQESIKSFSFNSGYELTTGGTNVAPSTGNVAPTGYTNINNVVEGVTQTFTSPDLSDKPVYNIVNPGQSFTYFETLQGPGLVNFTQIDRTTTIESISDSTSTFSQ